MKAFVLNTNNGMGNLIVEEVPFPVIQPNEVLIKVKAIGINPVDPYVSKNEEALKLFVKPLPDQSSFILGWDVSGTVVEAGPEVKNFKKGDDVFGLVNFPGQGKTSAEFVAAPENHLALKPVNISHEEAAAATLAGLTAWQALINYGKINRNEKVLIHAAAGGVGHYAVQIAKHIGAFVIATASPSKIQFVKDLGADVVIDYTTEKFEEVVKDADVVLDAIFGDHLLRSIDAVKRGGRVISLLTYFEGDIAAKAKAKDIFGHRFLVVSNGADMMTIARLLASGELVSHVSRTYSFSDLPEAYSEVGTGKTKGKIVVTLP